MYPRPSFGDAASGAAISQSCSGASVSDVMRNAPPPPFLVVFNRSPVGHFTMARDFTKRGPTSIESFSRGPGNTRGVDGAARGSAMTAWGYYWGYRETIELQVLWAQ
jgi:hypothetical protein